MKSLKLVILTFIIMSLGACSWYSTKSFATYEEAEQDAIAAINMAKSANYEWRDSRKILKAAKKLNTAGKKDAAMKMVAKAKEQATLAMAQAKEQSGVAGPR